MDDITIAELFVNLGVKGEGSAKKALDGTKSGLSDIKSMSLEAKAAIIGAIYALERMMSTSAKQGTELLNFASITGLSAQKLQEWQYAARQAGVDGQELQGSLQAVQNSMSNMLLGKGAPEGLAMVANKVGFDVNKARDTFYVMQQLQKFAQQVPQDIGNQMLKSFGLNENTIAAMRRNAFRPEVMAHAPKYSDREIGTLNKVDVAWSNLGNKVKMAMGHLTAREGLPIITEISKLTDQVFKLIEAFTKLAEKLKLFEVFGKIFEGWGLIFQEINKGVGSMMGDKNGKLEKNPIDMMRDYIGAKVDDHFGVAPKVGAIASGKTQNIEVNQNLNFQHDGKEAHKTAGSVSKAVKDAYRQYQAQAQGS